MFNTQIAIVRYLERVLGDKLTDIADEYGEPGYHTDGTETSMIVLGSYWCRCDKFGADYQDGSALHDIARHYPKSFELLEERGVVFEWYDEWTVDHGRHVGEYPNIVVTSKAYRTTGDSYSWQPSAIITDDGELLTPDDDIETWISYVVNDPHRAIPSDVYTGDDLLAAGFTKHNGTFEHGWHPGQDANPEEITERVHAMHGEGTVLDVVFVIDGTGQFDMAFSAYYREQENKS